MRGLRRFSGALLIALAVGGCAGSYQVRARTTAVVTTSPPVRGPTVVAVGPDVWVVENYPTAVFYNDGFYWNYRAGIWYRSYSLADPWVRVSVSTVPVYVRRIDRPSRYAYYVAPVGARRIKHHVPPGHARGNPPEAREGGRHHHH